MSIRSNKSINDTIKTDTIVLEQNLVGSIQTHMGKLSRLSPSDCMKISARNQLKGTVRMIKKGPVNSEVHVALPGGEEVVSVITTHSAEKLKLQEGKTVYAIMKASEVMIGID